MGTTVERLDESYFRLELTFAYFALVGIFQHKDGAFFRTKFVVSALTEPTFVSLALKEEVVGYRVEIEKELPLSSPTARGRSVAFAAFTFSRFEIDDARRRYEFKKLNGDRP